MALPLCIRFENNSKWQGSSANDTDSQRCYKLDRTV
jgi:hypothetical protein